MGVCVSEYVCISVCLCVCVCVCMEAEMADGVSVGVGGPMSSVLLSAVLRLARVQLPHVLGCDITPGLTYWLTEVRGVIWNYMEKKW